ncbi:hypothetical protein [Helicovermis profundi]|uniref:Uncharacterized protein n=1 Tax=Helicovermis profundi TaxID=3065157 RepID=A0AAU9E4R6_9FIRM|nr:hypothetical protein HLPR_19520 [Clostridia bacterium S502]
MNLREKEVSADSNLERIKELVLKEVSFVKDAEEVKKKLVLKFLRSI